MVWYDLKVGKYKVKYTSLSVDEKDHPYCNADGKILKRISGKIEKGYFEDDEGNRYEKAFKLINGKASDGFKGRIKEVENPLIVEETEAEDVLVEKEFLVESEELYKDLLENKNSLKFGGWFGNGYKAYRCYIIPSKLFKGWCIMKVGRGCKSEIMRGLITGLDENRRLAEKLKQIDLDTQKINKIKVEDMLSI
jgi:hypothetical protein